MFKYILAAAFTIVGSVAQLQAAPLTDADIESCIETGLHKVLTGKANAADYIDFPQVVYAVFGPPARGLTDDGHQEAAYRLGDIMATHINRHKHRFSEGVVTVDFTKQSTRRPNVYGAEGEVHTPSRYRFTVQGTFTSATQCRFHRIWIHAGRPMVQYLKEQPEVMALCTELTGQRC